MAAASGTLMRMVDASEPFINALPLLHKCIIYNAHRLQQDASMCTTCAPPTATELLDRHLSS